MNNIILIWILLGLHSCYYLVKSLTKKHDFTKNDIGMLFVCFLLPIVSHIATYMTFVYGEKNKSNRILFKKRK